MRHAILFALLLSWICTGCSSLDQNPASTPAQAAIVTPSPTTNDHAARVMKREGQFDQLFERIVATTDSKEAAQWLRILGGAAVVDGLLLDNLTRRIEGATFAQSKLSDPEPGAQTLNLGEFAQELAALRTELEQRRESLVQASANK